MVSPALLPRLALAAIGVATAALAAGCVTRTVYVVDDRDEPAVVAAAPQAAPQAIPPRGADLAGPEEFYEPLAPYGSWHAHPRYGYVFAPHGDVVGAGWRPYSRGHWEYTEWGWTWVSDLPFGWATSHYGRWFYDSSYGWVWVPGTEWAPAWVTWRTGGGYVGWAPMPPGAVYGASYSVYDTSWIFVSTSNFGAPVIYPVIVTGGYYRNCLVVTRPYRSTYVVYGATYYRGPDPRGVQREGGRVVHRSIREVDDDRPTTRPPRGVRVETASHSGHDGSTGARRNGRGSDDGRSGSRGGIDEGVSRPGDSRGGGRESARGDDRAAGRGDGRGQRRGEGLGNGRDRGGADDRRGQPDGRDGERGQRGGVDVGGEPRGPDMGTGGDQRGNGRGQGRDDGRDGRDDDRDDRRRQGRDGDGSRVPPGHGGGRSAHGDAQAPDSVGGGLDVVTPTPYPGGRDNGNGNGSDRGNGSGNGNGNGSDDQGGVRANDDVVRPDRGEVRPPSDNPYGGKPGGSANSFGAQSAPSAGPSNRSNPADSRFGRRLPSRFGAPSTTAPETRAPYTAPRPTQTPPEGYGRVSPTPSKGYGRVRPSQSRPDAQPPRSGPVTAPRQAPSQQRYNAPPPAARQTAPAPRQAEPERKQQKKKREQKKKGDDDGKRPRKGRR